jgi:hypothetical protein
MVKVKGFFRGMRAMRAPYAAGVSSLALLERPLFLRPTEQTIRVTQIPGSSLMLDPEPIEFQMGRWSVDIAAAPLDLPGVTGWVGTWHIYRLPRRSGDMPVRYGDTDIVASADIALGMARSVAILLARSL